MSDVEAVDLFLHAPAVGFVRDGVEPGLCFVRNTARSFRGLAKVDPHFVCQQCQMVNEPTLDDYIEVSSTISPKVRVIAYHDPESSSAEDRSRPPACPARWPTGPSSARLLPLTAGVSWR